MAQLQEAAEQQAGRVSLGEEECELLRQRVRELEEELRAGEEEIGRLKEEVEQLRGEKQRYSQRVEEIEQMVAELQGEEDKDDDIRGELTLVVEERDQLAN